MTLRDLAYTQLAQDKNEEALRTFGRCREIGRVVRSGGQLSPDESRELAYACRDEGKLAQELNRAEIARLAFAEGVEAFQIHLHQSTKLDPKRPQTAKAIVAQAECHFYLGRHQVANAETDAARANFQSAVDILKPFSRQPDTDPAIRDIHGKAVTMLEQIDSKS
jgi:hypothetical protein